MEKTDSEGAVDRAHSPSVSPCANEHKDGIEGNQTIDGTQKSSDGGKLGSVGLAVNITILEQINVVLQKVAI